MVLVAAAFVVLAPSCAGGSAPEAISVTYQDKAEPGFIDQTVLISSDSGGPVAPTIEYTALDSEGDPVPGIHVSTAYGSDRGLLVVPASGAIDILVFSGERLSEVVGATGTAREFVEVAGATAGLVPQPEPFHSGVAVTKFDVFDHVSLTNSETVDVTLRVVCLLYDFPAPGDAQQAEEVSVVVDRLMVPAGETVSVQVAPSFAERSEAFGFGCDSLKAHHTPPG